MIPVTFEAAEKLPIFSGRPAWRSSSASRWRRSRRPSASSRMTRSSAIDSRQGSSLEWCSYGPTNTTGRCCEPDQRGQAVLRVEALRDPQPERAHELVDRGRRAGAAEQHDVLLGAAHRLVHDPARVVAQAHRLAAGRRRLGVRVRVQRQHLVADEVLDEAQRAAGRRVVGVHDALGAERPGQHEVVADDRAADEVDERVALRRRRREVRERVQQLGGLRAGRGARAGAVCSAAIRARARSARPCAATRFAMIASSIRSDRSEPGRRARRTTPPSARAGRRPPARRRSRCARRGRRARPRPAPCPGPSTASRWRRAPRATAISTMPSATTRSAPPGVPASKTTAPAGTWCSVMCSSTRGRSSRAEALEEGAVAQQAEPFGARRSAAGEGDCDAGAARIEHPRRRRR